MDYQKLIDRYTDEYGNDRVLDLLAAELDLLANEYGSLQNYADPDEEDRVLGLYSINEANALYEYLNITND